MGKKLVIKGADFSENGFAIELVKKEITALYDRNGVLVTDLAEYSTSTGVYFYENTNGKLIQSTINSDLCVSTTPTIDGTYIDVEDYTDAEIKTVNELSPQGVIAGVAVLFFLDESLNIVGGFSTGGSLHNCVNVGTFNTLKTFSMKVPAGSRYCVATVKTILANASSIDILNNFKITLSKKVIQY